MQQEKITFKGFLVYEAHRNRKHDQILKNLKVG